MHKNCCHQSCSFWSTKSFVGWGFAPDPTGGAYSAPQTASWFRGWGLRGKGRRKGGGKAGRKGEEGVTECPNPELANLRKHCLLVWPWNMLQSHRGWRHWTKQTTSYYRVLTTLENLEISGNLLIPENSGNTHGIKNLLREFTRCYWLLYDSISWASSCVHNCQ